MSVGRVLTALLVVFSVTAGVHYYLWARLVRDAGWAEPWTRVAGILLAVLGLSLPAALVAPRVFGRGLASPIAWVGYVWMGAMFFFFVVVAGTDLVVLVVRALASLSGSPPPDEERRRVVARALAGLVGLVAGGASVAALATALRPVGVKKVQVPTARLPAALRGFRIVQMSDIHVGPTLGRAFVEDLVAKCNAQKPDVVAITGDLVDGSVAELGSAVEPLRNLVARHGVFFVTGNHEYYSGADEWIAFLRGLGVTVLRNERVALTQDGVTLQLAGVDDWTARGFGGDHGADLEKALRGWDGLDALVLLAHQPKAALEAAKRGVSLQLSGHTHGGQLFPFNFLVRLQQPFVLGLHMLEQTRIYVSPGTGYWGPPMRLGFPAEITHLELVPAMA